MKDERIIEEMALLEGFEYVEQYDAFTKDWNVWSFNTKIPQYNQLPDYLTDNNAVQMVIDGLDGGDIDRASCHLATIVDCRDGFYDWVNAGKILKATPRQKCEAILKALGKWEEE